MDMTEPTMRETQVRGRTTTTEATATDTDTAADDQVLGDDLVEEISIDGMCGVY